MKGDKEFATMEGKKAIVRKETNAVSSTRVTIVRNRHRKPTHPLSHQLQKHEAEVRREKGASEAGVRLGGQVDSRAKNTWKVLAPNHLVTIGILPNALSQHRDVDSAQSARFVEEQPNKRPKKGGD